MTLAQEHESAQGFAAQAELAAQQDQRVEARELYEKAAALERVAFLQVSREKARTRGILAVSFVSMLYKGHLLAEAERELFKLLADDELPEMARRQLRELLEVVWDEKAVQETGFQYTGNDLLVAMRGGEVGIGSAPLDLMLQKADGFRSLITRVAEWQGEYKFRAHGRAPREITDLLQVRATQARAASYEFTVRFAEPVQPPLFPDEIEHKIRPTAVAAATFEVMRLLSGGTEEQIKAYMPEQSYRKAFTQLVRNIVPTKHDAREIEVRRISGTDTERVFLVRDTRARINEMLRVPTEEDSSVTKLRGVLRALHLDQNWIEVLLADGSFQRCETRHDMLDDVVGPMVNRSVIAYGRLKGRRGRPQKFHLDEIEFDEEEKV